MQRYFFIGLCLSCWLSCSGERALQFEITLSEEAAREIEALDLEEVIADVAAHVGRVRKDLGHPHFRRVHARAYAAALCVAAVRIAAAEPEAPCDVQSQAFTEP